MRFPFEPQPTEVLFRADRPSGEWVLRRRSLHDGRRRYELILNGKLLMDSADGSTEGELAEVGLRACAGGADLHVLVGGLGFGYTLGAVLRDPRVRLAEVVELERALFELLATPEVRGDLACPDLGDGRVRLTAGDVHERLRRARETYDCILLDVDNGPESLSAAGNGDLYTEEGLATSLRALRAGGALAIWSSEPAPACLARMRTVFGNAEERIVPAVREGRRLEYRILCATRPHPLLPGA